MAVCHTLECDCFQATWLDKSSGRWLLLSQDDRLLLSVAGLGVAQVCSKLCCPGSPVCRACGTGQSRTCHMPKSPLWVLYHPGRWGRWCCPVRQPDTAAHAADLWQTGHHCTTSIDTAGPAHMVFVTTQQAFCKQRIAAARHMQICAAAMMVYFTLWIHFVMAL